MLKKHSDKKIIQQQRTEIEHLRKTIAVNKINEVPNEFNIIKDTKDYEYLVLSGGGIKGLSYIGALQELNKFNILYDKDGKFKLKGIAGASAGTILASLLAVGYTIDELIPIMSNIDFAQIVDDKFGYVRDSFNLITKYGICKGQYLYDLMGDLIQKKTGDADYTLKQLYNTKNIKLIISVTNLTQNKMVYLNPQHSHDAYADIPIRKCVRMSTSVPFLFEPYLHDGCLFADGGTLDNYPIEVFDVADPNDINELYWDVTPNYKVLGLKIITNNHDEDNICKIKNIYDYACSYVDTFLSNNDKKSLIKVNWIRTIFIITPNYSLTKFDLTEDQKTELIENGSEGVNKYFN